MPIFLVGAFVVFLLGPELIKIVRAVPDAPLTFAGLAVMMVLMVVGYFRREHWGAWEKALMVFLVVVWAATVVVALQGL